MVIRQRLRGGSGSRGTNIVSPLTNRIVPSPSPPGLIAAPRRPVNRHQSASWLLIAPPDRHNDPPAPVAFPAPEAVLQVEHRHERRQSYALLQAGRRYQFATAADALDVDEIAGA
jgi:hypothetical protein